MSASNRYIVGIDIGTTKVVTLIGNVGKNNILKIEGSGISECRGMKKGLVVDINEATRSVLKSIEEAERSTKYFIDKAFIGVTGKHVSFLTNWSEININSSNHLIRKADVDRLITMANKVNTSSSNEIIHTLIKQFVIDNEKGIVDPVGLSANKLAVELLAIYGSSLQLNNVINTIKASKIEVEDIILEALASSEAVLTPEEKESGVMVLDIGGGTTDIAVYRDKKMIFTYCLPVGGNLISNDISVGLNITFSKAEEIKKKYANVDYNFYESLNNVNMGEIKINRNKATLNIKLYNIVNSRVKEMMELIKEKVEDHGFMHSLPCGVVLTGGSSRLKGIKSLAASVFDLPVKLGLPYEVEGPSEVIDEPIYSTGVGLLKYAHQLESFAEMSQSDNNSDNSGFINRFREFISKILKN
ncbi:MAG: cell division protein FtsA [Actinomycetia bacterium]|nr:cell division protein FtsA [Actinomycetes bacterium]